MNTSTGKPTEPSRYSIRSRLRKLLLVVAILVVPLGWVGRRLAEVRRERATIVWVEKMGGTVTFDSRSSKRKKDSWGFTTEEWFGERVREVDLDETPVSDLSPLVELNKLVVLRIHNTQVSDLSPLADSRNLEGLYFSGTQVSDLSPLRRLENLESLNFGDTPVSDLSFLADLNNLEFIFLNDTKVRDLSPLKNLRNLRILYIGNTKVRDVSPLAELNNLETLWVHDTPVSDKQVEELEKAFPNCNFYYGHLMKND